MTKRERPRWFPLDQIDRLENAIDELVAVEKSRRDGIAIALGFHGLRAGEVSNCLARHFQPELCQLHVETLKKGIPRTITMHRSLVDAICSWRSAAGVEACRWLLPTRNRNRTKPQAFSGKGKALLRSLGVHHQPRFHMLRHTFAMRLLAATNDIVLVKQQLGHASIQTTMVYAESLKTVPTECLLKLVKTPSMIDGMDQNGQLKLFEPLEYGKRA